MRFQKKTIKVQIHKGMAPLTASDTEQRKAALNRCVRCGLLEIWQDEDDGATADERRIAVAG